MSRACVKSGSGSATRGSRRHGRIFVKSNRASGIRVQGCKITSSMPTAFETLVSDYPSVVSFPVLWGDMDAFQHVNNTASIRWFESSRIRLLERPDLSGLLKAQSVAPILAAVSCSYRRQLRYPDTVHVGSRVSR